MNASVRAALILTGLGGLLAGCGGLGYVAQATGGQLALLRDAQPISKVVRDPNTPSRLRALLWESE